MIIIIVVYHYSYHRVTNMIVIITIRIKVAKEGVSSQTLTLMPPP